MRYIALVTRCLVATAWGGLLLQAGSPAKAAAGTTQDQFIGEWLLAKYSDGGQRGYGDELTLALKISGKGNFHNVVLEVPISYPVTEYGGFSWPRFIERSNKSLKNMTPGAAKRKYTGDYLMDVDGGSISHPDGSVTFTFNSGSGMLCEPRLGCFRKGNQSALIESYKEQRRNNAKAEARAKADAKAEAKARARAEAEARVRAAAEAKAAAEAEARKPRVILDKTFTISSRQDVGVPLTLASRSLVSFQIAAEEIDLRNSASGRNNRVRAVLLDEDGSAEWPKLKDNFSLLHVFRRVEKKAETITGPCPALLKIDVAGGAAGECILEAGQYYFIFYDGYPGFRNIGQPGEATPNSFTARLQLTTALLGSVADAGNADPSVSANEAGAVPQVDLASKYQSSRLYENGLSFEEVVDALNAYQQAEGKKAEVRLLEMNGPEGRISWVQDIGSTGKTVTTKVAMADLDSGSKVTVTLLGSEGLKIKKTSAAREMGAVFGEVDKLSR